MKWNDEEGFFEIEAESNTTFQAFEGIRNTKDSSVDLEKIRNSDNPASGYIIFAIDGDTMDGLCELHSSPLQLAAMLRAVFDTYELNDDLIFDLMKIAKGKE